MTDVFNKEKRSKIMSGIKAKETQPEILVRKYLFSKGFRYRKNDPRFPGKPDIVLPKYKKIIFIHGCFWHGHSCMRGAKLPETRTDFWRNKIISNKNRDYINKNKLEAAGWRVIVLWDCEIRSKVQREKRLELLVNQIIHDSIDSTDSS
jgi:DNA mismatch endonuclease, patch repair protein